MVPEILLAASGGPKSSAALTGDDVEWALESGLGPWLHAVCVAQPELVPEAMRAPLRAADLTARVLTAERVALVAALLDACAGDGVNLVLLKGISTSSEFYPQPHWRTMGDVDLLVPRAALPQVEARLRELDCRQQARHPDFYRTHHHSAPFRHRPSGLWIEMHTGLVPPTSLAGRGGPLGNGGWEPEQRDGSFAGRPALRLSPELQLVYTANHWAEELKPVGGVFGLLDIALILRSRGDSLDWPRIEQWMRAQPLGERLRLALACAERLGAELPPPAAAWLRRRGWGERAGANLLWRLTRAFSIRGEPFGRWRSRPNTYRVWQRLVGGGGPWRRLGGLPLCLLLPPGRLRRLGLSRRSAAPAPAERGSR